jgi:hypothetical protein
MQIIKFPPVDTSEEDSRFLSEQEIIPDFSVL